MYDNGLLRFYKQKEYKDGFLKACDISLKNDKQVNRRVMKCVTPVGSFYKKPAGTNEVEFKERADAEILLSQIYNHLGIKSAVYLPVENNGHLFLLSNDLKQIDNVVQPKAYLGNNSHYMKFLQEDYSKQEMLNHYFTHRALEQQSKLRVLDVASYVTDRHVGNYYYHLHNGKADNILALDCEKSGDSLSPNNIDYNKTCEDKILSLNYNDRMSGSGLDFSNCTYRSEFTDLWLTRQEMFSEIETNEKLNEYIDKSKLAEEIGSINPHEVAQDIKETTGYIINPSYVDNIARSYNETAEMLER